VARRFITVVAVAALSTEQPSLAVLVVVARPAYRPRGLTGLQTPVVVAVVETPLSEVEVVVPVS
jgi:hypothetical protein